MKRIKEVARTFDGLNDRYERWFSEGEGKLVKEIETLAIKKLLPEGIGLEVGIGSGIFASKLEIKFGVDPADSLLRKAHSRGLEVVSGIGERLPFKDNVFDFLLFMVTLCFLADPPMALREARRVLKPGGKVIVCFIPRSSSWGKLYMKKKSKGHDFYKYAHFYENSQVKNFLEGTGFKFEEATSSLFQRPNAVVEMEEPVDELNESAGLCCIKAKKPKER